MLSRWHKRLIITKESIDRNGLGKTVQQEKRLVHADQNKIEHLLDMVFVLFARPVYEQCALFDMRGGREGGSAGEENTPQKVLKGQDGWGGIGVSRGSTRRNIEHRFGCALFEELGREKRINIRGLVRDSCEVSLK